MVKRIQITWAFTWKILELTFEFMNLSLKFLIQPNKLLLAIFILRYMIVNIKIIQLEDNWENWTNTK